MGNRAKRNRKINKAKVAIFILLIILIIVGFLVIKFVLKDKNPEDNNVMQNESITIKDNEIQGNGENIRKNQINLKKIDIPEVSLIYAVCELDNFERGEKLSTDTYLKVAYNVINNGYANIEKKSEYSENEIKSIVYTIFGVELQENKSYESVLRYENGVYKFEKTDNSANSYMVRNIEPDVAAGTKYFKYDLVKRNQGAPEEEKGKFVVAISNQNKFVISKKDYTEDAIPKQKINYSGIHIEESKMACLLGDIEDFNNTEDLSTDTCLKIAYNAINEGYVNIEIKNEYSEEDIKGIIYGLLGVELQENKSYGSVLRYENGVYKFERSDRGEKSFETKNIEIDVAAGTRYVTYDLYEVTLGESELKGKYVMAISNQQDQFVVSKKVQ